MQVKVDLKSVNSRSSYSLLDEGWYPAMVIDSKVEPLEDGHIKITWSWKLEIGRWLKDFIPTNSDWGLEKLKRMAQSCGHPNPDYVEDTEELHGLRCLVKVVIKHEKNWINGFKPLPKEQVNKPALAF